MLQTDFVPQEEESRNTTAQTLTEPINGMHKWLLAMKVKVLHSVIWKQTGEY